MRFLKLPTVVFYAVLFSISVFAQGLTIGNNAVFSLGSATLMLASNFENNGTFNPQNGTVAFTSPSGNQTYTDVSEVPLNNFTVNKASGDVILTNNITINGILTCLSGDLNLNGKVVSLGPSASLSESGGATVKGTSGYITATRTLNSPNLVNVAGLGVEITSAVNLGSTTIIRKHNQLPTNTNGSILRNYDITPTNNTGLNATLTFHYDSDEINGLVETDLQMFRSTNNGSSWFRQGGAIDVPNKKITISNLDGFSLWTLANNESITISNAGGMIGCSNGSTVEIFKTVFLTDPDDINSAGAVIQITNNYESSEDRLLFSDKNGITSLWDQGLGRLTLSGVATKDIYADAIKSVKYGVSSNSVTENIRTFSLTVTDGFNNSNTLTKDIKVTESNMVPYLVINTAVSVVEGKSVEISEQNLKAMDDDGANYSIKYNTIDGPDFGEFLYENKTTIGSFTQNDIANKKISYHHYGGEENSDYIIFTLSDEAGGSSEQYRFDISLTGFNDAPSVEQLPEIRMKEDTPCTIGLSRWYEQINDVDNSDQDITFRMLCNNQNICIKVISDTLCEISSIENFHGIDSVFITFKDPAKDSCSVTTKLIIEPVNDLPEIKGFPSVINLVQNENKSLFARDYLSDIESPDSLLKLSFESIIDSVFTNYDSKTGVMNILSKSSFTGTTELIVSVIDEDGGKNSVTVVLEISKLITGISDNGSLPDDYILYNCYPNPFNPSTKIRYGLPSSSESSDEMYVQLKIYDLLGNEVESLVNEYQHPGYYEYQWNASNAASGIYFYLLRVNSHNKEFKEIRKMILMK